MEEGVCVSVRRDEMMILLFVCKRRKDHGSRRLGAKTAVWTKGVCLLVGSISTRFSSNTCLSNHIAAEMCTRRTQNVTFIPTQSS